MTTTKQELDSGAVSVADLLSDQRRFQVPLYQRNYVWSDTELSALWSDIDELIAGSAEIRFLGALVLQLVEASNTRRPSLNYIIDGQQRITTMFLLLTAIASTAQDEGFPDIAESIETTYLVLTKKNAMHEPKVDPAYPDLQQFNDVLEFLDNPRPNLRHSHGRDEGTMADAFLSLCDEVSKRVKNFAVEIEEGTLSLDASNLEPDPAVKPIGRAIDYFLDLVCERIQFIEITLDERHDPNEVFHRLNTAGQPLEVADLVRNDVFRRLRLNPDQADQIYHREWTRFEESFGKDSLHNSYYWPFTVVNKPDTSRARMFTDLQTRWDGLTEQLDGSAAVLSIIKDLEGYVPAYLAIADDNRPDGISNNVWDVLRLLSDLNLPTITYPFFLAMVRANLEGGYPDESLTSAARLVESFLVRRALGGIEPTGLHRIFYQLWHLTKGDLRAIRKHLESRTISFPDDDEVRNFVRERPLYGARIARYVIAQYETSLQAKSKEPLASLPTITIDHVMPQDRAGDWLSAVSEGEHESLVHNWANLVPLSGGANSLKGNKGFAEAKVLLANETKFESAKAVLNEPVWDASVIESRGNVLADWAVKRWPSDPT